MSLSGQAATTGPIGCGLCDQPINVMVTTLAPSDRAPGWMRYAVWHDGALPQGAVAVEVLIDGDEPPPIPLDELYRAALKVARAYHGQDHRHPG